MIDSHAHLTHRRYTQEEPPAPPADILRRAGEAGIEQILAIACELNEWQETLALATIHKGLWVAAALHPGSVDTAEMLPTLEELVALAAHPKLIAYGETGLDAKAGEVPSPSQTGMFIKHLMAARQTGLPVCLHTRGAEDLVLDILQDFPDVNFVYHCFTGTAAQAARVLKQGGYISLSGIVTFSNAKDLQAVAKTIPPERLLLETDAPYLAPTPFRGKRNEPALVAETYKYVANLLGMPLTQLAPQVAANFHALFPRAKL
ncbi:MAG TPA: TatD family hydrolase [Alphaproteobacteria bacterium]|nr:TatD family hydrolase [Alphaproteobacteria bacterium]